jgi:hypothetical protein
MKPLPMPDVLETMFNQELFTFEFQIQEGPEAVMKTLSEPPAEVKVLDVGLMLNVQGQAGTVKPGGTLVF